MATGWICEERYFWHDTGNFAGWLSPGQWLQPHTHIESSESKRRIRNLVEVSGLLGHLEHIRARYATPEELLNVHTSMHVDRMRSLNSTGGFTGDTESPFGPGGYDIARLAAGGVISAVDAVWRGKVSNAYALVRPPGHHAATDTGMGFCMFNNAAVAIRHAQKVLGAERVAVIDWDVHHGNGTQGIFYTDPTVLTISIHQDSVFPPHSGSADETGAEEGEGFCINIPLPGGSGGGAYEYAFERVVEPAVAAFQPNLILVACGFDSNGFDAMARMDLHSDTFRSLMRRVMGLATQACQGKVVVTHEGGYAEFYVPFCGLAVLEELSGHRTAVVDPYLESFLQRPGQELLAHQRQAVDKVANLHFDS